MAESVGRPSIVQLSPALARILSPSRPPIRTAVTVAGLKPSKKPLQSSEPPSAPSLPRGIRVTTNHRPSSPTAAISSLMRVLALMVRRPPSNGSRPAGAAR